MEVIKEQIKELVRGSVEETPNELLEAEAEKLTQAARYERNEARQGYRSGHYDRNLTTTSGDVTLHAPCLKGVFFETAIIERYRLRESSVVIAVNEDGYREVLGAAEGMKEDKSSWVGFLPVAQLPRSGWREARCRRQMSGEAGGRRRGLS